MKVFISWSGERSRQVAELLNVWIQCVLQAVDPWLSTRDIDKGSLWFSEITNQLSNTHNGIVCLTKANLNNAWILFEAGALAKGLSSNRVFTVLIDLQPNEVKDPLAQFNHTIPNREGMFQLVRSINNGLGEGALKEVIIGNVFDTYWPQFQERFDEIIKLTPQEDIKIERPEEDILNEVLYSVRAIDRRLRKVESSEIVKKNFESKIESESDIINMPLEDLEISVRLFNLLKTKKINCLKDISDTIYLNLDTKYKEELSNIISGRQSK